LHPTQIGSLGERGQEDLAAYFAHARYLARYALDQIGWQASHALLQSDDFTNVLLARIVGRNDLVARPLQIAGEQLLQCAQGPSLLLVEAPMGEGKTELAFLAHLRLQARNGHRGLYVALPTQATGNALFQRLLTFLGNFATASMDVQLVHGGASMNDDLLRLRDVDHSHDATLSASLWFSQRRRPLLSPYGVGTVDQALLATLNVKHHFVRLWGLSNRVVVLDEIHAYDTYTTGLIVTLLQWLRALGSSVVLMSATLPKARRDELMAAWGVPAAQVPDLPYPRVLLADETGIHGNSFTARPLSPIRLHGLGESVEEMASKAIELLAYGGCGALIVNTVERAQLLYRILRDQLKRGGAELLLFHARFPADERREHEQRVLERFGLAQNRPERALLIATQVAEQSLDIDFDFMLSDLAPVDLLLQRAGRLHRHIRPQRPAAHGQAYLWVAGLVPEFPDLKKTAWGFVYDPYILGRTWARLRQESVLQLPDDIERLVQWIYGDEPLPEGLEQAVQDSIEIESYGQYLAKVKRERQQARNITLDCLDDLGGAYNNKPRGNEEGDDLRNVTRLGRDTVVLVPVESIDGGWKVGDTLFQPEQCLDHKTVRQLYNRQINVSHTAVVQHFQTSQYGQLPASFGENGMLRYFYPLVLVEGCYKSGKLNMRLDRELGLVFDT
jgi:CRISPR-associated endonuclease/helicase Cas3